MIYLPLLKTLVGSSSTCMGCGIKRKNLMDLGFMVHKKNVVNNVKLEIEHRLIVRQKFKNSMVNAFHNIFDKYTINYIISFVRMKIPCNEKYVIDPCTM